MHPERYQLFIERVKAIKAANVTAKQQALNRGQIVLMPGLGRANGDYGLPDETHLYEELGPGSPGRPMCERGWNRDFGTGYSIFRGNVGDLGVCPVCEKRLREGLPPVDAAPEPETYSQPYTPLKPGLHVDPLDYIIHYLDDSLTPTDEAGEDKPTDDDILIALEQLTSSPINKRRNDCGYCSAEHEILQDCWMDSRLHDSDCPFARLRKDIGLEDPWDACPEDLFQTFKSTQPE